MLPRCLGWSNYCRRQLVLPAKANVVQLHLCNAVRLLSGEARHGAKLLTGPQGPISCASKVLYQAFNITIF